MKSKRSNGDYRRILVRVPNWIGDAVLCLPALAALKDLYPRAPISVLAKKRVAPIFENSPAVTEIIEYDDKGAHKGFGGRLRLSRLLKERKFDLAVLFQNAFDAAFLSFISRIPERTGYARDLRTRLLTRPVKVTDEITRVHQTLYYMNIVNELAGRVLPERMPELYVSDEEGAWAEGFLRANGLKSGLIVGAAPGASYGAAKRWDENGFADVLARFISDYGLTPVIFGGPEDKKTAHTVSSAIAGNHLDLAGELTLRQSIALIRHARVFITNDSGPMHIAAALGVPTVAVFGSTDPVLTGPVGKRARVAMKGAECAPCFKRTCRYGHYRCLVSVGADEVFAAAEELMKETMAAPDWRGGI